MPTTEPRPKVIADLLVQHFEELEFLWAQRRSAFRSSRLGVGELAELDDRIGAHVEGLQVGGKETIPIVEEGLSAADSSLAFASAYTLLNLRLVEGEQMVMGSFREGQGPQLTGISEALCHGAGLKFFPDLLSVLESAPPAVAAAAAEVLAFHGMLPAKNKRFAGLFHEANPAIQPYLWRACCYSGDFPDRAAFQAAFALGGAVAIEALQAAAWTRQRWLAGFCCEQLALPPTESTFSCALILALLAEPNDAAQLLGFAAEPSRGPKRFKIVSTLGHSSGVPFLLKEMRSADLRSAIAAGEAFTEITGRDLESTQRTELPPEDGSEPDEFEKEFLDEAFLPDPALAEKHWSQVKEHFATGTRWRRGVNLTELRPELSGTVDLEGRWHHYLRAAHGGIWKGRPTDLLRFSVPAPSLGASSS